MGHNRLTQRQENFCIHFAETGNATDSYRKSYDVAHWKEESVQRKGHAMLQNVKVQTRIDQLRERNRSQIATQYALDRDKTIQEYIRLAFADIRNIFDEDGRLKDIHDLDDDTAAAVAAVEVVSSMDGGELTYTHKIKLIDKRGPLQDIAKMLGLFEQDNAQRNKSENNLNLQVNFVRPDGSTSETVTIKAPKGK